jgi:hypothetical protein
MHHVSSDTPSLKTFLCKPTMTPMPVILVWQDVAIRLVVALARMASANGHPAEWSIED